MAATLPLLVRQDSRRQTPIGTLIGALFGWLMLNPWGAYAQVGIGTTAPRNFLDVQAVPRTGTHPTGRPLYVTGTVNEAANGFEFRHSNGTQGIGIGYNSLYATGSNINPNLNLLPRGTGRVGIGTTTPAATLHVAGATSTVRFARLSGTGTRVVAADADGDLATVSAASQADNLGNHTAT